MWENTWFRLPPEILDLMKTIPDELAEDGKKSGGSLENDMSSMFDDIANSDDLAQDKVMLRLIREGYNCLLALPLRDPEKKTWRSSLTLMRKDKSKPFLLDDLRVLRDELGALGLLRSFMQAHTARAEQLKRRLSRNIRNARSLDDAIRLIPNALANHYHLQHVSYFWCNYGHQKFELHHQSDLRPGRITLPENFKRTFDEQGQLSLCLQNAAPVVVNNVEGESAENSVFLCTDPEFATQSSLTIPIVLGGSLSGNRNDVGRVAGILHLQSASRYAFPPEIIEEICKYVRIIEETIYGLQRDGIIQTLQREIPSGLILFDHFGTVWGVNEMALQMLGVPGDTAWRPKSLRDIFLSEQDLRIAAQPLNIKKVQVVLKHHTGSPVNVLIDTADLPWQEEGEPEFSKGLRLIQMTDLNTLRWEHDIESVKAAVAVLAGELKPHLATAHGIIRQIQRKMTVNTTEQSVEKKFEKLNGILKSYEITADKVMKRLGSQDRPAPEARDTTTNFIETLDHSLHRAEVKAYVKTKGLPKANSKHIDVSLAPKELSYIFDTVLDYLLTRKSTAGELDVFVRCTKDEVVRIYLSTSR